MTRVVRRWLRYLQGVNKLAAYGALVSTLAVGWQVFQYVDRRPVLNVTLPESYGLVRIDNGPIRLTIKTRVWNTGTKPVTIFSLGVSPHLRRIDGPFLAFTIQGHGDRSQFPFKLGEGEAKPLDYKFEFVEPSQLDPNEKYEICTEAHMVTTSGDFSWPERCGEVIYGDIKSDLIVPSHDPKPLKQLDERK